MLGNVRTAVQKSLSYTATLFAKKCGHIREVAFGEKYLDRSRHIDSSSQLAIKILALLERMASVESCQ